MKVSLNLTFFQQILHSHGILVLGDGAHAPGQADFRIDDLGVDFYTARCQFHQHSTSSFYACRSQKRKKQSCQAAFLCLRDLRV